MAFSASAPKLAPILLDRQRAPHAVRLTRDDVLDLDRAGRLPRKFELVEGEIVDKMAQGLPHRIAIMILVEWLFAAWGRPYIQDQATVDVAPQDNPTSEPQPDLAALNVPLASLKKNPQPKQVDLLIEVSDTSVEYDLGVKAGLYARAGVREYWVFDLSSQKLHALRSPRKGVYRKVDVYGGADTISPVAKPNAVLRVASVFPSGQSR